MPFPLNLLATGIGSLPHSDPEAACRLVIQNFPEIPSWPQLPRRSFKENMYVQFSEGFPGVVLDEANERIWVDRSVDLNPGLEELYSAYLENDVSFAAVSPEYGAGLAWLPLEMAASQVQPRAVKGQVTGPISWGLTVTDENRRPVLYDETLADAAVKLLRLKAGWLEGELRKIHPSTVVFVDEPYLSAFGSAFISLSREQVVSYLGEVFGAIQGLKGVHCCGNTDWSILASTAVDVINFDAYSYAESLALYPEDVRAFLARGGAIAWGIVPADNEQAVWRESVESLMGRLQAAMNLLIKKGVHQDDILAACLVTSSCGLRGLSPAAAERALSLVAGVAKALRERYG
ncbi:MAG: methionine synthase [Chloroflexota bacterium]